MKRIAVPSTDTAARSIENFSGKHIPAGEFRRQMRLLKDTCQVLSMDDVVDLAQSGGPIPRNAVAITFDDGYRNNCTVAAPILDECGLPATFYICAGMIDTGLMFATDMVEDCINLYDRSALSISLAGAPETIATGTREERIAAVNRIKGHCKVAGPEVRARVLADLAAATGVTPDVGHPENYRALSWAEVREMDASPLFTIGGHSLYHHTMSALSPRMLALDIRTTLGLLEFNLGHQVRHFAYPEGQPIHYNAAVIDALHAEGVVCSLSAIDGINESAADLFNLRRLMVGFHGTPFPFDAAAAGARA